MSQKVHLQLVFGIRVLAQPAIPVSKGILDAMLGQAQTTMNGLLVKAVEVGFGMLATKFTIQEAKTVIKVERVVDE